ncbi:VPLPA-CTERM sorting domain-containing protein [Rhodosalinus sp. 5P4]|uniref:VPLPA-CTERM sorting domain-containing protein n=1 Tax=Rhodosalinus sp. 5P4 TaxID=3239196 RepID=UPI0035240EA9
MFGFKKILAVIGAAAVFTVVLIGGAKDASASLVGLGDCFGTSGNGNSFDVTNNVEPTTSCFSLEGLSDGSGDKLDELNGVEINGATGGWNTLGKFEPLGSNTNFAVLGNDSLSGKWKLFDAATSLYGEFMMVFKAGSDSAAGGDGNTDPAAFVGYILNGTSGEWFSPLLDKENGEARDVSNVELYGRGEAPVIPLPAAGWMLLSALGGLGLVARRRRKAS